MCIRAGWQAKMASIEFGHDDGIVADPTCLNVSQLSSFVAEKIISSHVAENSHGFLPALLLRVNKPFFALKTIG